MVKIVKLFYIYYIGTLDRWLEEQIDLEDAFGFIQVEVPSYFKYIFRVDEGYIDDDHYVSEEI